MGPTIFQNANYDFIGKRYVFLGISVAFMAACLGSIFVNGMNLGVEFTGGAQLEVNFDEKVTHKAEPTIEAVRKGLDDAGLHNAQVVTIGSESDHAYLIRVQALTAA